MHELQEGEVESMMSGKEAQKGRACGQVVSIASGARLFSSLSLSLMPTLHSAHHRFATCVMCLGCAIVQCQFV